MCNKYRSICNKEPVLDGDASKIYAWLTNFNFPSNAVIQMGKYDCIHKHTAAHFLIK